MLVNNMDVSLFHATYCEKDIQPATITTFDDWLRQSPNPLYEGQKKTFKQIKVKLLVQDVSDDACLIDISNLTNAMSRCTLQFSDSTLCFDCTLTNNTTTRLQRGVYNQEYELKSGFAYGPVVTQNVPVVSGQSATFNVDGNQPTPVKITINVNTLAQEYPHPPMEIPITIAGVTKKPILINNPYPGLSITLNGDGTCVSNDFNSVVSEYTDLSTHRQSGRNVFVYELFPITSEYLRKINPTNPTRDILKQYTPYRQMLIPNYVTTIDAKTERQYPLQLVSFPEFDYDQAGYLKTAIMNTRTQSATLHFKIKDKGAIYIDGQKCWEGANATDRNSYVSINWTWSNTASGDPHIIEFFWIHHGGSGTENGFYDLGCSLDTFGWLDCYYCKDTIPAYPSINKFSDVEASSFPILDPGDHAVSIWANPNWLTSAKLEYCPKYM